MQGICQRKKIPAARKFPSPPITFLMVRPLRLVDDVQGNHSNQSSVTLLHTIDPRNRCAETPESLHVPVPFFSASSVGNREKRFGVKDALF